MQNPIFLTISWNSEPNEISSENFLNNNTKLSDDVNLKKHLNNGYRVKSFSICPHKTESGTEYITALIMLEPV